MNSKTSGKDEMTGALEKTAPAERIRQRVFRRIFETTHAKRFYFTFLLIMSVVPAIFPHCRVSAQDPALSRDFIDGVAHYKEREFRKAAEAFDRVADSGIANGDLFYNLGNAHLKSGDLGKAILWYERARRLIPDDPDLKFNLDYARSLVKDAREEKRSAIAKVLFFWRQSFSHETVKYVAIFSNLTFWTLLVLKRIRTISWRRAATLKALRYLAFASALVFALTALHGYYLDKHRKDGVVISGKASVRSGLSEDSTELFVLHAGSIVTIEKEARNHYRIYFSDDKIGWLKKTEVSLI